MTPAFELLRLAAEEVAEGVSVVELEGRWTGPAPPLEATRLLCGEAEVPPVPATAALADGFLRARFALPAAAATEALVLAGDGLRVRLPVPDGAGTDRLAALARELNRVRHERETLQARLEELQGVAVEVAQLRREREELPALREELERLRRERDELTLAAKEVEALRRERDEAAAEAQRLREELVERPTPPVPRPAGRLRPEREVAARPAVPIYFALAGLGVFGLLLVVLLVL